jgi:hypothetical protein
VSRFTEQTRDEVIEFLVSEMLDSMFADGGKQDIILNGIDFKGLHNMTDQELYNEMLNFTGETEDLVVKARRELSIALTQS